MTEQNMSGPDTIILIHGLWMTAHSWDGWVARFNRRGFNTLAIGWPGIDDKTAAEVRRDPSPLATLSVTQIIDHYSRIIRGLDKPPIIMGHSLGGSFTQILLGMGLGAAAVGVAPATVRGVRKLPLSTLRSSSPVLGNPFNRGKAVPLTLKQFTYAFANTLSEQEAERIYEEHYIPAAASVLFEVAFADLNPRTVVRADFGKDDRAPMLFIAGEYDHVVPPTAAKANAKKYASSKAITEYKEFPGRTHYLAGQEGWEEIADYALDWAIAHTAPATRNGRATSDQYSMKSTTKVG